MGAYENPKIIPPPDYGQIFRTNFVAGQQLVQSAIDRRNAKIEKEKAKQQTLADKQLAFDLKAGEIKAGDLTGSLQKLAYNQANIFGKNEAQWANGDISFEEYTSIRNESFRVLQELKQTGVILDAQSKAFDKFERSSFQHNPELLALAEAWKNKAIIPEYIDGELFLNYKVGEENHTISVENFKEGSFFDMVEKYDISNETMTALNLDADIKKKINKRAVYDASNNIITSSSESYVENKETYVNRIKEGSRMKDLLSNVDDAGSIWADNISKTTNEEKLNQVLESIAISKNITGKEKEAFINAAKDGIYTNGTITDKEGKKLNYRELINEASAQILAERSFDNYLPNALKLSGGAQGFQEVKATDSKDDSNYFKKLSSSLNILQKTDFKNYTKKEDGKDFFSKKFLDYIETIPGLEVDRREFEDGRIELQPTQFAKKEGKKISIRPEMTNEEIRRTIARGLGVPEEIIKQTNFSKDMEIGQIVQGMRDQMNLQNFNPLPNTPELPIFN